MVKYFNVLSAITLAILVTTSFADNDKGTENDFVPGDETTPTDVSSSTMSPDAEATTSNNEESTTISEIGGTTISIDEEPTTPRVVKKPTGRKFVLTGRAAKEVVPVKKPKTGRRILQPASKEEDEAEEMDDTLGMHLLHNDKEKGRSMVSTKPEGRYNQAGTFSRTRGRSKHAVQADPFPGQEDLESAISDGMDYLKFKIFRIFQKHIKADKDKRNQINDLEDSESESKEKSHQSVMSEDSVSQTKTKDGANVVVYNPDQKILGRSMNVYEDIQKLSVRNAIQRGRSLKGRSSSGLKKNKN